ncbi:Planctomycete cytochrome C [Planctopirus limnophila DSM 3776]|uniref:Planctomycete cytochrome C n=2 Tax=Planctopirus limnophila TaxID=120 RepID=D5SMV5_PLAL2|nr:Planctomycete cytochrome C [Planctopirus limnophila DSM 3776]
MLRMFGYQVSMLRQICFSLVMATALIQASSLMAAITPEQRQQLNDLKTEIGKVPALLSKKKLDEATAAVTSVEEKLNTLVKDGIPETEALVKALRKQVETQRGILAKQQALVAAKIPTSFSKEVAPILEANCVSCHGEDNPRGGLRMDTFAGMERGGTNGALVVAGNPLRSPLVLRLTTTDNRLRMPKNEEALKPAEIQVIAKWISEGAKYDAMDKTASLGSLAAMADGKPKPAPVPVEVAKPTGNEKVSFINDVAPTLVTTCGQCHLGNNPRGGFSVATFERMMQGGESGRVIVPGSLEGSRLWRLVNADEAPVMPAGQGRITRKWHADLRTWITEGAKFDGPDAKRPLMQLVPTPEEIRARELAKMTPEQLLERRRKDTNEKWEMALSSTQPNVHETDEFIMIGDVDAARLKELAESGSEFLKVLKTTFGFKETPVWKGKLAVFVFKERFGYEEFNQTINRREVPKEIIGHADVSPTLETALVAIYDVGDDPTEKSPGAVLNLAEQLAAAALLKGGGDLPDWLIRGTGLSLAASGPIGKGNPYVVALKPRAAEAMQYSIQQPQDVFQDGTFSPADVGPAGYAIVEFLMRNGGASNFGSFVKRIQGGDTPAAALQAVYRQDARTMGASFLSTQGAAPGNRKAKKK